MEEHRACLQFDKEMLAEERNLLRDVDTVGYDVEDYARRLDEILAAKMKRYAALQGK